METTVGRFVILQIARSIELLPDIISVSRAVPNHGLALSLHSTIAGRFTYKRGSRTSFDDCSSPLLLLFLVTESVTQHGEAHGPRGKVFISNMESASTWHKHTLTISALDASSESLQAYQPRNMSFSGSAYFEMHHLYICSLIIVHREK